MTDSKKPTHRAFVVKNFTDKEGQQKSHWHRIGSVWPHHDGKGFNVTLESLPTGGRLVLRLDERKAVA